MRLKLFALSLFALLLAACAPMSQLATLEPPGAGDVLPVEAQRIIDAATATAGAQATQDARATQIDLSSRQTATAARQGTLDALQGRQTEVSLQITQGAGYAGATDTQAARTQAAAATAAWATPTAAAMRTQAAIAADDFSRRRLNSESAAQFWATVRTLIIALLVVAGLSAICVAVLDAVTRIKIARLAQQAVIAREAFRLLPPGHWAEWAPNEGYQVYALPGLLDAPAAIIENAPTAPDKAHAWRQSVRLFAWWGERYGFGMRELGPAGAGVVTDPAWRVLSKLLKSAGVLAEVAIPGQRGRATAWAPEWNYRRLFDDLGHGRLALPFPADDPAPEVRFTVPNTTPQIDQHNTATQKASD